MRWVKSDLTQISMSVLCLFFFVLVLIITEIADGGVSCMSDVQMDGVVLFILT